jgi:hypothetical protein
MGRLPARLPNKALQLTWHSAFQSTFGSLLALNPGASVRSYESWDRLKGRYCQLPY